MTTDYWSDYAPGERYSAATRRLSLENKHKLEHERAFGHFQAKASARVGRTVHAASTAGLINEQVSVDIISMNTKGSVNEEAVCNKDVATQVRLSVCTLFGN